MTKRDDVAAVARRWCEEAARRYHYTAHDPDSCLRCDLLVIIIRAERARERRRTVRLVRAWWNGPDDTISRESFDDLCALILGPAPGKKDS